MSEDENAPSGYLKMVNAGCTFMVSSGIRVLLITNESLSGMDNKIRIYEFSKLILLSPKAFG